jgi:hypothetical protein
VPPSQAAIQLIITGKGPLRESFEGTLRNTPLTHIRVWTVWLKADDYPALLGCAQLGIKKQILQKNAKKIVKKKI